MTADTETPTQLNSTDVIERSEQEHERLELLAQLYEEHVVDACQRVGVHSRDSVIDIGCGAIGGRLPFSHAVGPTGRVVGLDLNSQALAKARAILARRVYGIPRSYRQT